MLVVATRRQELYREIISTSTGRNGSIYEVPRKIDPHVLAFVPMTVGAVLPKNIRFVSSAGTVTTNNVEVAGDWPARQNRTFKVGFAFAFLVL